MKPMQRYLIPVFVLIALALGAFGVAFARELTGSQSDTLTSEEIEFTGVVESINGNTWTIAGRTVLVDIATELKDFISVGQTVKVHASMDAGGALAAREIELAETSGIEDANDNLDDDLFEDDNANDNEDDDLFENDNANDNEDDDLFEDDNANDNEDDDVFDDDNANDNEDDDVFDDDNANDNSSSIDEDNSNDNSSWNDDDSNDNGSSWENDNSQSGSNDNSHEDDSGDHDGGDDHGDD
jgi:hypothetical protein